MPCVIPMFFVFLLNNFVPLLGNYLSITNIVYDLIEITNKMQLCRTIYYSIVP